MEIPRPAGKKAGLRDDAFLNLVRKISTEPIRVLPRGLRAAGCSGYNQL